ncbi:41848936-af73-405a-a22d-fb977b24c5d0 [Thermothielavioides terrestris]|uniref:41848936-af73-405a-a22d-fb977b24c5d0 n=1 Tax=Thermothielavioides terrestris TaxID=2587410 RepID=A0A3S4BPS4_9PEZI|nr:41848936-af73-405a-a22d-fb977b24c5d0 [Thermothielavioides terrestris]
MLSSLSPMSSHLSDPASRPNPLRPVRSFRVERSTSPDPKTRAKRASTIENASSPTTTSALQTASGTQPKQGSGEGEGEAPDTFVSRISEEAIEPPRASVDLDDLPIELVSLTDRFIDSLSAKVHPTPPNIDNLSRMFQEFYATASSHIQTHVDSLATLQRREDTPSLATRPSAASLLRSKAASLSTKEKSKATPPRRDSDQQLLTAEEYANRKKARRALEVKKSLLEEAVERRLCEGIYSKIYRHRSTSDEAQDAKLRSKTAALAVVDIGPVDLGVDLGIADNDPEAAAKKQEEVKQWLESARKELVLMSQSRYPLGKLNRLKAAHKAIIDTLSHFHPSSSADELMPMLIYTLITLPPENLNVISDVNFIQRFRWERKLTGEEAYCLTTLEATIAFLETQSPSPSPSPAATSTAGFRATVNAQLRRQRRLSDLMRNTPTPAQALNAASDAVLNTADQGLKTIGNSLGESYKFLMGKLRERAILPDVLLPKDGDTAAAATTAGVGGVIVPKTLDEARKLIGTPPPPTTTPSEDGSHQLAPARRSPSPNPSPAAAAAAADERPPLFGFIAGSGRKVSRDHSADSARSAGSSSRRAAAAGEQQPEEKDAPSVTSPQIMDSMRSLGNSLNPMARLSAGIGGFRGFGRSSAASAVPARAPTPPAKDAAGKGGGAGGSVTGVDGGDLATAFPDLAAALPPKEHAKISPPVKRFLEMQNAAELKLGEVFDLLKDYKRLAGVLKEMGAFKE